MIRNKPSWVRDRLEGTWLHLPEPEAVFSVFYILGLKAVTPPGNEAADAPAWVQALATDPPVDTTEQGA